MKALNNLIAWLYILGTIALGLCLVTAVSGMYGVKEKIQPIIDGQLNSSNGIWTGLVLVLLGFLFFVMRVKADLSQRSISFDNPEGEVTITIRAIEDFVKRVGQEFSQVEEMSPTIISTREGIKVRAKTVLVAGSHVPRLAEGIQHTIKSRMQNILGIENVTTVEVHVSKLVTKPGNVDESAPQPMDVG